MDPVLETPASTPTVKSDVVSLLVTVATVLGTAKLFKIWKKGVGDRAVKKYRKTQEPTT